MGDKIDEFIDGLKAQVRDLIDQAYDRGVMDERARILLLAQNLKPPTSRASSAASAASVAPAATPAPKPVSEPEPADEDDSPLPEPVDCASLPPLTPLQFEVFSVIAAAKGQYLSASEIDLRTGKQGSFGSLSGVVNKGYLIGRATPGRSKHRLTYHVAVFGTPQMLEDGFERRGHKLKPAAPARRAEPADVETRPLVPKKVISVLVPAASVGPNAARPQQAPVHTSTRKINAAEYLKKRGVRCEKIDDAWWTINGVKVTKMTLLIEVNKHRYAAELGGVDIDQIE